MTNHNERSFFVADPEHGADRTERNGQPITVDRLYVAPWDTDETMFAFVTFPDGEQWIVGLNEITVRAEVTW